ncbi:RNA binding methyltransferase FtsJ like [Prochlorococcus sp. MIT 0601]|nr:RNA binding methyltransferase FtsJ like [Prochlorococcus sp. MIT 0601]
MLTQGYVDSRQQAQRLIRAGKVRDVSGKILDKPGFEVSKDLKLIIKESRRFVSRGGDKLLAALDRFPINISGRICLDGGISTGGFTDCLLKHGASLVYGIDVGYGQTAWSLREDPRVVLKERTNLRYLRPEDLYKENDAWANFVVADLSFISLKLVLPSIKALLMQEGAEALLLIKPQFEVGRSRVGKGGVVRDAKAHLDALKEVINFSCEEGWKRKGILASPITGPAGNNEYLLWLGIDGEEEVFDLEELVKQTLA